MNELMMLPIEWLEHHPDNPRKDLGDLKELTASIRESGVMQNLTVVPRGDGAEGYWVVIGNRRLEASRAAGLKQLPCLISDMDYKTQLATMMAENMQRVDLTLLEQAQGVQMMMDLGMEVGEIAKKTGLREDAINRRAALMKFDPAMAGAAIARGGSLTDFIDLEKVEDTERRDKLLKEMGSDSFRRQLTWALEEQKQEKLKDALCKRLDLFATQVERHGYVGVKAVNMTTVRSWYTFKDADVTDLTPPEDLADVRYYWLRTTGSVTLLREALVCTPEDPAVALENRKRAWKRKKREQAEQVDKVLRQMRYDFLHNSPDLRYDEKAILRAYAQVVNRGMLGTTTDTWNAERFTELTGVKVKEKGYAAYPEEGALRHALNTKLLPTALALIWMRCDREVYHSWSDNWQDNEGLDYKLDERQALLYELLTACGYRMCQEEKQYMDGTHEIYRKWVDE